MSTGDLKLDRMAIEDAGPNPERIAAGIHQQLALPRGPTPIAAIARALDIVEIRRAAVSGFEAALVAEPERGEGAIVVNCAASPQRQTFSIAHELGHFLNSWHQPIEPSGRFACRNEDLRRSWRQQSAQASRHVTQEAEANRFAIELLAPDKFVRPFLGGVPDLAKALQLARELNLSREAAARRYVERHDKPTGLVVSRNGVVRYIERRDDFPFIVCGRDEPIRNLPPPTGDYGLSDHVEADARDFLSRPSRFDLIIQTLHQRDGFAITLLALDGADASDEDDEE